MTALRCRAARAALACALLILGLVPAFAEVRIALVVGNSAYGVGRLDNPANDAEAITNALTSVGFQVTKVVDADQATLRRAVVAFGRRLKAPDTVGLFYYAGHGVQVAGENYLVPVDADIADEGEIALQSMNLAEVLRIMSQAQGRPSIVVLDACRNNPFSAAGRAGGGGLAQVVAPAGTMIAFATAPGQTAADGEGANSPYSAALAANIPVQGIVLEEVFRRTRRQVLAQTGNRQTPWEHSSLTAEWFFRPSTPQPEASGRPAESGISDAQLLEIRAWDAIRDTRDPVRLIRHLETWPNGLFADVVRARLTDARPTQTSGAPTQPWTSSITTASEAERLLEDALKLQAQADPKADAEAVRLYRVAADMGLPAAMHQLARAYDRGRGIERSLIEAAVWFRRAADLGHAPSQAALGTMYEFAEGVEPNLAEALRLYQLAAEAGDASAMTSLAYLTQQGKGVRRDADVARRWYAKAVEKGSARAMYNLALMHIRGEGGETDFGEAVRLLKAAIEAGHVGALREMAWLFDEGRGVSRDARTAADYLLRAFKAGHKDARIDLLDRPEAWSGATRREIQKLLAAGGYYDGRITGFFDQRTRRAAEAYARS